MWHLFTVNARTVVLNSQSEAKRFGAGYVFTEHLLLGVLSVSDTRAMRVLMLHGIDLAALKLDIESYIPRGEPHQSRDMTLTPRAKRVVDIAFDESNNLSNDYIGVEHLLLGLIREGDGLAGRILSKYITLEDARETVKVLQKEYEYPSPERSTVYIDGAKVASMNLAGMDFKNVETEQWRSYHYANGYELRISEPKWVHVKQKETGDSHRVIDAAGVSWYIPPGWIAINWKVKEGNLSFSF